jgi:RNA polymerase sigma-70 factor, ECF subfamily
MPLVPLKKSVRNQLDLETVSSRRQKKQPVDKTDELYKDASAVCGAALRRLARGYEADPEARRDLLQEIHIELWRSLRLFDSRCSLQTWVYRIAHNVAASHIVRNRRASDRLVDLDALETEPGFVDGEVQANQQYSVSRLLDRIYRLKPLDRQIILLYLEGEPASSIAEITGLSASNVATKIHRIKRLLNRQSGEGTNHA